jgi:hypothetical protein
MLPTSRSTLRHARLQHPEQHQLLDHVQLARAKFKVVCALAKARPGGHGEVLAQLVSAVALPAGASDAAAGGGGTGGTARRQGPISASQSLSF